ncbi:MAG: Fe-S cluster assembly protein SufD [Candidatus Aenigmarchaeota archaeon]|nr:Fe-S cluster assembly protein SufD [Candidatus Aenigmarchaeota archaeon]
MLNKELVTQLSSKNEEPNWILEKRLEAYEKYTKLSTPLFKYGIGIFLETTELDLENIDPIEENSLVITCEDKEVEILTLKDALKKHESIIKKYFMNIEDGKISSLHKAFVNNIKVVVIPENSYIEKPINIKFSLDNTTSLDQVLIIAKPNTKVTVIEHSSGKLEKGFRSQVVEIIAQENAKIEYISVQNFSHKVNNFAQRKAFVEKDSYVYWLDCILGSKFTQSITTTFLNGTGACSKNLGLFLGDHNQRYDINVETVHNASKTNCDMYTKGVLNDSAKNVYRGLVKIQPDSYGCKGYQKSDTLLLGENTETDPVPVLEIHNNDVKCGHGATVGQIDKEKIFYMMSRGLSEQEAIETIIKGFFDPVLNQLSEDLSEELRQAINKRVEKGLKGVMINA